MISARLKFFDIRKCGFYLPRSTAPDFGGINDTLQNLDDWARDDKEIINTTTYQANPESDVMNTYFCDWFKSASSEDSILVLWNELPNDNGVIYGIRPMDRPGSTSMLATDFGSVPAIPGAPSYFWFIPERKVFATIKFDHSMQGKHNLSRYINGFMTNKSRYRVLNDNAEVIGYSKNDQPSKDSQKIKPKFEAIGKKRHELEDELLANIDKITRIIKIETLSYHLEDDRDLIERFFSGLLDNTPKLTQERAISHSLQFKPTKEQIIQIVKNHAELDSNTLIQNIGFQYNNGERIMLSGASVNLTLELNVTREEDRIISSKILLKAIQSHKSTLLKMLDSADGATNFGEDHD